MALDQNTGKKQPRGARRPPDIIPLLQRGGVLTHSTAGAAEIAPVRSTNVMLIPVSVATGARGAYQPWTASLRSLSLSVSLFTHIGIFSSRLQNVQNTHHMKLHTFNHGKPVVALTKDVGLARVFVASRLSQSIRPLVACMVFSGVASSQSLLKSN